MKLYAKTVVVLREHAHTCSNQSIQDPICMNIFLVYRKSVKRSEGKNREQKHFSHNIFTVMQFPTFPTLFNLLL